MGSILMGRHHDPVHASIQLHRCSNHSKHKRNEVTPGMGDPRLTAESARASAVAGYVCPARASPVSADRRDWLGD